MNISRLYVFSFVFFVVVIYSCDSSSTDKSHVNNSSLSLSDNVSTLDVNSDLDKVWVKYSFTNNEVNKFPNMIEESVVAYLAQFPEHPMEEIKSSLGRLVKRSESNEIFFNFLKDKFSFYLYNPNSPVRNDTYYEEVLGVYQQSLLLDDSDKQRDNLILELVRKNQVDSLSANFQFLDTKGQKKYLHSVHAKYKLLVFYDPLCGHCKEIIAEMRSSDFLNNEINAKEIVVLAIDPVGDQKEWETHKSEIPSMWINGFDYEREIVGKSLYNILGYPTIYLLDSKNRVVLKDVYFSDIEKYFIYN